MLRFFLIFSLLPLPLIGEVKKNNSIENDSFYIFYKHKDAIKKHIKSLIEKIYTDNQKGVYLRNDMENFKFNFSSEELIEPESKTIVMVADNLHAKTRYSYKQVFLYCWYVEGGNEVGLLGLGNGLVLELKDKKKYLESVKIGEYIIDRFISTQPIPPRSAHLFQGQQTHIKPDESEDSNQNL